MEIYLAVPRGFCAGVDRAVHIVESAIEKFGTPIYVRHEIVHNKYVVNRLKEMGAVFVEEVDEVPIGSTVIMSAHGVAESVYEQSAERNLKVLDATCPLVKKVHFSAKKHLSQGRDMILIGHDGHAEVEGTLGQVPAGKMHIVGDSEDVYKLDIPVETKLAYITQTTLSVGETKGIISTLKEKYPNIVGPKKGDLCYATTNRQEAINGLCEIVDVVLVVGASNSSNSNRLKELAESSGVRAYLISSKDDLRLEWFENCSKIGVSSGASAPEILVKGVIKELEVNFNVTKIEDFGSKEENVRFALPLELQD